MNQYICYLRVLLCLITILFYSCKNSSKSPVTPKEFTSHVVIKNEDYTRDSVLILQELKQSLHKREDFFSNTTYLDTTQLIIDTILYSPDVTRLAAFIMVKNTTSRQLSPDQDYKWYYDATCYLGNRQADSICLSWLGPGFTNSYSRADLSEIVRKYFFTNFRSTDTATHHLYDYNLDDVRFWTSAIWTEIEMRKQKKRDFEAEKKLHPENIYEPPLSK